MSVKKKYRWPRPRREFDVPLYGGRVYVFHDRRSCTAARLYLTHETEWSAPSGGGVAVTMERDGERLYLVGAFDGTRSTLVHELAHVALSALEHAGIDATLSNGEPMCYLLDSLCQKAGVNA